MHMIKLACVSLCFSLLGCGAFDAFGIRDNWTTGDSERLRFSWRTGWECFFGCSLDRALMVGTTEVLGLHPDDLSPSAAEADEQVSVKSSAPQRLEVEVVPGTVDRDDAGRITRVLPAVRVRARAPGSAKISVFDGHGRLLDRVAVRVSEASRLILLTGQSTESSAPIRLAPGAELTFNARALDEEGIDLSASGGWRFSVDDPAVAALWNNDLIDPRGAAVELIETEGIATLLARGPGTTSLRASVVSAEAEVGVRVTGD